MIQWTRLGVFTIGAAVALACGRNEVVTHEAPSNAVQIRKGERSVTVERGLLVAHALGEIGGVQYTNSLEAFQCNYRRGYRWFEVDLALTSDGELVCFHEGNEAQAGLRGTIGQLTFSQVEAARYAGRYPIPRFSNVLSEADRSGDVVFVTDTKGWSSAMIDAVRRVAIENDGKRRHRAQLVLQSYGEQDIADVKHLSRQIGADIVLTLYASSADDAQVEAMVRKYDVAAVVADARRFSPWLADRLHAMSTPILVHTINDHREILRLTRAGADGFYSDSYRPYGAALQNIEQGADCLAGGRQATDFSQWSERDISRAGDFALAGCAKRRDNAVELAACESTAAITGAMLAVPVDYSVHANIDLEGGQEGSSVWVELLQKNRGQPARGRERVQLRPGERRELSFDVNLPQGSPGIEVRLGLESVNDRLLVHGLRLSLSPMHVARDAKLGSSSSP